MISQTSYWGCNHEQRLDTAAAGTAGGTHSHLETVGAVEWPKE
jgi:hypothetical protein